MKSCYVNKIMVLFLLATLTFVVSACTSNYDDQQGGQYEESYSPRVYVEETGLDVGEEVPAEYYTEAQEIELTESYNIAETLEYAVAEDDFLNGLFELMENIPQSVWSTSFAGHTMLAPRGSSGIFIAPDIGHYGSGLYYFDFMGFPEQLRHIPFDFSHYVLGTIMLEGERIPYYWWVRPNRVRWFYNLNDEYFFVVGSYWLERPSVGVIGRLVQVYERVYHPTNADISWYERVWHAEKYLALPDSPRGVLLYGEKLYLATSHYILLVHNSEVIVLMDDMLSHTYWFGSVESLFKADGILYIRTVSEQRGSGFWALNTETGELNFHPTNE